MKDPQESKGNVGRRDFIKATAIGAGALALGKLGVKGADAAPPPAKWDKETDVVVVGFGGSGAAAAIEARRAGAKVVVLERQAKGGGSTAICAGIIYMGGGTPLQKACGFTDTPEEMYKYVLASCEDGADPDFVKIFCDRSVELYNWLVGLGVKFKPTYLKGKYVFPLTDDGLYFSGNERAAKFARITSPVPRGHHVEYKGLSGRALFPPLHKAVVESKAEILYDSPAKRLVVDDDGRVIGVEAEINGKTGYIKANKAVILTAGGFGKNKEMLALYAPEYLPCSFVYGTKGDDGAGIKMGQGVGADLRMMNAIVSFAPTYRIHEALAKGILVSRKGARFVGEDNYGSWPGEAITYNYPDAVLIIDGTIFNEVKSPSKEDDLAMPIEKLVLAKADTIEELATALKIPPGLLKDTVTQYNRYAAKGEDPAFEKIDHYLTPLHTPPYYGLDWSVKQIGIHTAGGLRINTKAQVLHASGKPIPGLYSAGVNGQGVISRQVPSSGVAVAQGLIFGRIAGQGAARG